MATGSAIFNEQQTYGNGLVNMQGTLTFSNGAGAFTITHGKGFSVTRVTTGVYKLTLAPGLQGGFLGMHANDASLTLPASQGGVSPTHPGFAQCGDLQADKQSFYIYTYNSSVAAADPASGSLLSWNFVGSMSNLNP